MKNLDNIGKCKWRKSPEATLHYSSNKNKGWQLVRNGRCCFMPANITAAETCCGSQCRTAQMKEMKTPKGALRCFFFSSRLGCCCFSSFPHHHQPPCYLHYGLISRHVSLVKKKETHERQKRVRIQHRCQRHLSTASTFPSKNHVETERKSCTLLTTR